MIERYTREKMKKIWDIQTRFEYYLKVEIAVCKAYSELGDMSVNDYEEISRLAKFDLTKINIIENEIKHDFLAFLTNVNESLGQYSKFMHKGLTSSDVIDTAFALQLKESSEIIFEDLDKLIKILKEKAIIYKNTVCIGRTHGVHAEVMTFGLKLLNWVDILERAKSNFEKAAENINIGQISGPVGTYSNIDPRVEKLVCSDLGLRPARISTQIIQRDMHAFYMQNLALIAAVIEQFATEIRHMQRTEIRELEEGFSSKQKGSSAMPHKKNPITCENLCGLARVVKGNSVAALENVVLWDERDISHSSAERIIFPDSLILLDFMLNRFINLVENLKVNEKNMLKNANSFGGIVFSQKVLLTLTEKGLTREDAYRIVQRNALDAFDNDGNFKENLLNDNEISKYLTTEEIEQCFSFDDYLKNVDVIFNRF
ncbi:adenylosuccinate lyase [bacterium]|nr:adenylosuccinate lyase [bacterium]